MKEGYVLRLQVLSSEPSQQVYSGVRACHLSQWGPDSVLMSACHGGCSDWAVKLQQAGRIPADVTEEHELIVADGIKPANVILQAMSCKALDTASLLPLTLSW